MRVRFVDLQGQCAALHDQALTAIRFVYTSHQFIAIQTRLPDSVVCYFAITSGYVLQTR